MSYSIPRAVDPHSGSYFSNVRWLHPRNIRGSCGSSVLIEFRLGVGLLCVACSLLKEIPSIVNTRVIFLSARNEDYTQLSAFDAGADDYISKPVKPKILLKKIASIIKRINVNNNDQQIIILNDFVIDRNKFLIIKDNIEINLPKKEFELLFLLGSKPGSVFTRDDIMNKVWGSEIIVGDRTIDVHIRKLREKIGDLYFKTVKGVGYKFVQ